MIGTIGGRLYPRMLVGWTLQVITGRVLAIWDPVHRSTWRPNQPERANFLIVWTEPLIQSRASTVCLFGFRPNYPALGLRADCTSPRWLAYRWSTLKIRRIFGRHGGSLHRFGLHPASTAGCTAIGDTGCMK